MDLIAREQQQQQNEFYKVRCSLAVDEQVGLSRVEQVLPPEIPYLDMLPELCESEPPSSPESSLDSPHQATKLPVLPEAAWKALNTNDSAFSGTCSYRAGQATKHLHNARKQGQRRLLRLRAPSLFLGVLGIVGSQCMDSLFGFSVNVLFLRQLLFWLGVISLPMSLLPSDDRCIPLVIKLVVIPGCLMAIVASVMVATSRSKMIKSDECDLRYGDADDEEQPCWLIFVALVGNLVYAIVGLALLMFFCTILWRRCAAEVALQGVWIAVHIVCITVALVSLFCRSFLAMMVGEFGMSVAYGFDAILGFTAFAVSRKYSFIRKIQSWLMSQGAAAAVAAGVAELLGGQEPEEVLAQARESFLCVKADQLNFDDFVDNTPNPALAALTCRARLGHVDAFVSHSWHDRPQQKWDALQRWRHDFKQCHAGKEPSLWIDKYCVDQNNVDQSLACLPVFLFGCKRLLVLCGSSYPTRLWCLIEIFVFLEMGGALENLEVRLLECDDVNIKADRARSRRASQNSVARELYDFDSSKAECSTEVDTLRLQKVIEASGNTKIDQLISSVFVSKL